MRGKILLVVGLGVGYVLGTRAGRERYDEIVAKAQGFWSDPRVQKPVKQAQEFVKDKAPGVAEFLDSTKKVATETPAAKKPTAGSTAAKK
jgi:hypothetical protein